MASAFRKMIGVVAQDVRFREEYLRKVFCLFMRILNTDGYRRSIVLS